MISKGGAIAQVRHWRMLLDYVPKRYEQRRTGALKPTCDLVELIKNSVADRGDHAWVEVYSSELWLKESALAIWESGLNDHIWPRLKPDWQALRRDRVDTECASNDHEDVVLRLGNDLERAREAADNADWIGDYFRQEAILDRIDAEARLEAEGLLQRLAVSAEQTAKLLESYRALVVKLGG